MKVEVDQSGKVGDTKVPTVLAFSNSHHYTIFIPATVKRACLRELRQRGKSGTTFYLKLFAIGLYLLLKKHIYQLNDIIIDVEYQGHNAKIKEYLLGLFQRAGLKISAEKISFQHIGKKSGAHKQAKGVYTGKIKPNQKVKLEEILGEF